MDDENNGSSSSSLTPANTPTSSGQNSRNDEWKKPINLNASLGAEMTPSPRPGWYGLKHMCPVLEDHGKQNVGLCPFALSSWDDVGPSHMTLTRAQKDIAHLHTHEPDGIYFYVDEANLMFIHSMIVGSPDSPYAGGFFHFMLRFGPQYPFEPPRVCCMTSYRFGSSVRFHPNLYENGYICLSLLGTWGGPRWSAANNAASVMLSIQSIFTANALCLEPGMERFRDKKDAKDFDVFARHETLRVAVLETVKHAETYKLPDSLIEVMRKIFLENFDSYISSCDEFVSYDKNYLVINLRPIKGLFMPRFGQLKQELIELKKELEQLPQPKEPSSSKPSEECAPLSGLQVSNSASSSGTTVDAVDIINDGSILWDNSDDEESAGESYEPSEDDNEDDKAADTDVVLDDGATSLTAN